MTHATPSALYAHVSSRYWEDDSKVPVQHRQLCKDIARQLLESRPGRNIDVILGGGKRSFVPVYDDFDRSHNQSKHSGRRLDGRNLIHEWLRYNNKNSNTAKYISNRHELMALDEKTEKLLGLFSNSHLSFRCDKSPKNELNEQPTLSEMTNAAINVLSRDSKGFILVVESGRIDHAHHHNNAYRALDETLVLEEAVETALLSKEIGNQTL